MFQLGISSWYYDIRQYCFFSLGNFSIWQAFTVNPALRGHPLYIFLVSNKIAFISVLELWWYVFLIVSYVLGIKIMPLSIIFQLYYIQSNLSMRSPLLKNPCIKQSPFFFGCRCFNWVFQVGTMTSGSTGFFHLEISVFDRHLQSTLH
jgi:hypothetical protein